MDIPVPTKEPEVIKPDAEVATVVTAVESPKLKDADAPAEQKNIEKPKDDDRAIKLAELINSKTYNLNIKEKRTKPLLVLSLGIKRKKKSKAQHKAVKKTTKPQSNKKQMTQIGLLVALVVGLVLAIDIGWLDIGIKLPFSLFGN